MRSILGMFGRRKHTDAFTPDQPPPETGEPVSVAAESQPDAPPPTPGTVLDAMHDVIDPELGYNIVDIGLIYECHVNDSVVQIIMTMTTPGCPAQDYITRGVYDRGMRIPGVSDMDVELIWHPPWSVQMMTPVARAHFRIPDDPASALTQTTHVKEKKMSKVLDVRQLIPMERHRVIFETWNNLPPGESFLLVNDHDPRPLYYQFEAEHKGAFSWHYVEEGPATWQVEIGRVKQAA
ncbi:MAG TPA: DUF2249 domain-containing protein [Gammaproteobacteria bacterium]|nr:DUF2249 domain-containing protein [Gammaproteobacteria bacterium]